MPETAPAKGGLWGRVMSIQANYYWVQFQASNDCPLPLKPSLLCTRRARLKKIGQQVMVGDMVRIEEPDWEGERGAISAIQERQSQLDRPPIANADQILLVFALAEPDLDAYQLTRFLVKAELTGLKVCLCLNKRDLVESGYQAAWRDRLTGWGYTPNLVSVWHDDGLSSLMASLRNRTTVVSGPSGVGKSSLINTLIPTLDLRINAVSGKLGRGRHTTRHVELFELEAGGVLADTPGFNQPDITCSPDVLGYCFPEIRDRLRQAPCQFSNCLHRDEPGCVVRGTWERYPNYLKLLDECMVQAQHLHDSPDPDNHFKVKVTRDGRHQREPRLQAKTYRRSSRRSHNQTLHHLRYDLANQIEDLDGLDEQE